MDYHLHAPCSTEELLLAIHGPHGAKMTTEQVIERLACVSCFQTQEQEITQAVTIPAPVIPQLNVA